MNKVYKTISLEDSKSRLPGVIAAIVNDKFQKFDEDFLKFNYSGNYGLIVSDITIPDAFIAEISDVTNININILTSDHDREILKDEFYLIQSYDVILEKFYKDLGVENYYYIKNNNIYLNGFVKKYLTYYKLKEWYKFFNEYYYIVCVSDCDGRKRYDSAYDYYINEVEFKTEEGELYYKSIDDLYNARGGDNFYYYIKENYIIQYDLPIEFQNGWNGVTSLYYPEIIKWKSWFTIRHQKYQGLTEETCGNNADCIEYLTRGGDKMYQWIKTISFNYTINENNTASINISLNILTSIDDMGEMTIFSKEWESGENYHNDTDAVENKWVKNNGGVLAIHDNKVLMLKDNNSFSGYTFDSKYKEILFDSNQWSDYYDYYLEKNDSEFKPNYTTYTYNRNNTLMEDPTPDKVSEKYNIIYENIYVINNIYYKPFISDYIEYSGAFYGVHYYDNGIPYTVVNNRTYVALFVNGKYKFNFKFKPCKSNSDFIEIEKNGNFIYYNGGYYQIMNNVVIINKTTYPKLDGYTNINNINYYIRGDKLVTLYASIGDTSQNYNMVYEEDITFGKRLSGEPTNESKGYTLNNTKKEITIYYPYYVYSANEISGITTSSIEEVKDFKKAYDDIGNELPGFFALQQVDNGTIYVQPKESDVLDLYYKVGNTSNISKLYDENNEVIEDSFFGNILTDIEFYYRDNHGDIVNETIFKSKDYNNNNLEAINECLKKREELRLLNYLFENEMSCNIVYYIGGVIKQNKSGDDTNGYKYSGYTYTSGGVKYTDVVRINKKECSYYLSNNNSYILYYYEMIYPTAMTVFNDYENKSILVNKANFLLKKEDYKINNGCITSPSLRLEYKFGTSSLQNIKSDVYVDRGISNALDKHLKLSEVGSFESLSQYSNGQFNIINNN